MDAETSRHVARLLVLLVRRRSFLYRREEVFREFYARRDEHDIECPENFSSTVIAASAEDLREAIDSQEARLLLNREWATISAIVAGILAGSDEQGIAKSLGINPDSLYYHLEQAWRQLEAADLLPPPEEGTGGVREPRVPDPSLDQEGVTLIPDP